MLGHFTILIILCVCALHDIIEMSSEFCRMTLFIARPMPSCGKFVYCIKKVNHFFDMKCYRNIQLGTP